MACLKALTHSLQITGPWVHLLSILPTLQRGDVSSASVRPDPTSSCCPNPPDLGAEQEWAHHLGTQQALEHLAQAPLQGPTQGLSPAGVCSPSTRSTGVQH